MIGSGHKSDKIFAHYANHIKKESALKTIAETSEKLYAPIFEELAVDEIEYTIIEDSSEDQKLLSCSDENFNKTA